jgi:hypothetical protein
MEMIVATVEIQKESVGEERLFFLLLGILFGDSEKPKLLGGGETCAGAYAYACACTHACTYACT